ncbi:MAG: curli assembly protein CsgF [Pseudomonadota bacterium]
MLKIIFEPYFLNISNKSKKARSEFIQIKVVGSIFQMKSLNSTHNHGKETLALKLASMTLAASLLIGSAGAVQASELLYKPINPSFGGNPFNSAHLLGTADRQNKFREEGGGGGGAGGAGGLAGNTAGGELVRSVERVILNKMSDQIRTDLENPGFETGEYTYQDTKINIDRFAIDKTVRITVTNTTTGEVDITEFSDEYLFQNPGEPIIPITTQ